MHSYLKTKLKKKGHSSALIWLFELTCTKEPHISALPYTHVRLWPNKFCCCDFLTPFHRSLTCYQNYLYLALRKLLYPNKCGYAMETGGMMHDIRSLTVQQIRQYGSSTTSTTTVLTIPSSLSPVKANSISTVTPLRHTATHCNRM